MEAILQCRGRRLDPGYDNVNSFRNREHRRPLHLLLQQVSPSVVRQKRFTVKMFFSNILVDCDAGLGIGGRLET